MTTASLPHGHTARRILRLSLALLLAALSAPLLAANPPPAVSTIPPTSAPSDPLAAMAPVELATPDSAPIAEQLQALQAASAAPSTSTRVKTVLQRAFALLGTPYRWGGSSPDGGFDCSGLVGYVFRSIGIDLPRVSRAMANEGVAITDRTALAEGDLVFFGRRGRVDHVGIYVGDGKFLHAPRTGRDVTVSSLTSGYWAQKYMEARRVAVGG
ncbi:C40 family peptidase [Thermomonas sp.]|uniref:C40 family peptidase n=1 Tax=Thermomonas sp. TaxID=1971895 RepID=UPI002BBF0E4D|nr:C40 family peptidase [Thermomonas sp.]